MTYFILQANTGKNRERFGKNAGEWTGRVEISKEEIPGSKRSMYGYILTVGYILQTNNILCLVNETNMAIKQFCVSSVGKIWKSNNT